MHAAFIVDSCPRLVGLIWLASDGVSFTTNMQGKTCVDHNFLSGVWCDDDG